MKKTIGISAVLSEESCWYSTDDDTSETDARRVQIDLLIDRCVRVVIDDLFA